MTAPQPQSVKSQHILVTSISRNFPRLMRKLTRKMMMITSLHHWSGFSTFTLTNHKLLTFKPSEYLIKLLEPNSFKSSKNSQECWRSEKYSLNRKVQFIFYVCKVKFQNQPLKRVENCRNQIKKRRGKRGNNSIVSRINKRNYQEQTKIKTLIGH